MVVQLECVHHERLSSPDGGETVRAVCQRCGQERLYLSAFDSAYNRQKLTVKSD